MSIIEVGPRVKRERSLGEEALASDSKRVKRVGHVLQGVVIPEDLWQFYQDVPPELREKLTPNLLRNAEEYWQHKEKEAEEKERQNNRGYGRGNGFVYGRTPFEKADEWEREVRKEGVPELQDGWLEGRPDPHNRRNKREVDRWRPTKDIPFPSFAQFYIDTVGKYPHNPNQVDDPIERDQWVRDQWKAVSSYKKLQGWPSKQNEYIPVPFQFAREQYKALTDTEQKNKNQRDWNRQLNEMWSELSPKEKQEYLGQGRRLPWYRFE